MKTSVLKNGGGLSPRAIAVALMAGGIMPISGWAATVTLYPSQDAMIWSCTPDNIRNDGTVIDSGAALSFGADAWTWYGGGYGPGAYRGLMQFDLSSIPQNAVISDARLSLYKFPTQYTAISTRSGSNKSLLQRITSSWDEHKVNWNIQPPTTSVNQAIVPEIPNNDTSNESWGTDLPNLDVTALVKDMVVGPNYGFMMRLETEQYYRSLFFSSSNATDPNLRPKLVVTYEEKNTDAACAGVINGLVACYPFDGDANDGSGNGRNGSLHGNVQYVNGIHGQSAKFSSYGDMIQLPNTSLNGTRENTISLWLKMDNSQPMGVLSAANPMYDNEYLLFIGNLASPNDAGKIHISHHEVYRFGNIRIDDGKFHHVVVTTDANANLKVYVDGFLDLTMNSGNATPLSVTSYVWLGQDQDAVDGKFDPNQQLQGLIDDLRIYNRALTEAEIKQLYGVVSSTKIVATLPATICAGSTFDVTIRVNKTDAQPIDGAELVLKFDKSKLKVNKVTDSGVFDTVLDSKYDNTTGDITFTAGAWNKPAATSSFDLFTINFTALSSTAGTTLLDFVNDSIALTSGGQAVTTTATDQTLTLNQCLNYKVNLQRANAKGDPSWITPLKVSVGSATSAVEYNTTCDVNGLGMLILSKPVAAGEYICVKNSHTLANRVTQPFGNPVNFSTLLEGDANNTNTVDLYDLSFSTNHKGCKGAAGTQYDPQADFNVSGCVDSADKLLLSANYKKPSACKWNDSLKTYRDGDRQTLGLSATALPDDLKVGDSFNYTIQLNATASQPADGAALYLNFDPTQLQVNQVTTGSAFDVTLESTFDNDQGEINVAAGVWDNPAPTTTVDLVTINFTTLQAGEHTLTFSHAAERETVITHAGEDVTGTLENGQIAVKSISTTGETVTCPLYGVQDQGLNDSILFTIDSESKQVLPLGEICTGCDIETLDIQPVTNVPYLASGNNARQHPNGHLYKLNTQTGQLISVGNTGFEDISSLAFDKQGTLWAWAKDAGLVKLDTSTGEGSVVIASSTAFADLTWNTEGTTLYGAIGTELWSYTPATNTVAKVCDNLPEKTEAIRVLPTLILPKGFLLLGAHEDNNLKLHAFDTETCQLVAEADILIPYDDVEGLAMSPAPCMTTK